MIYALSGLARLFEHIQASKPAKKDDAATRFTKDACFTGTHCPVGARVAFISASIVTKWPFLTGQEPNTQCTKAISPEIKGVENTTAFEIAHPPGFPQA